MGPYGKKIEVYKDILKDNTVIQKRDNMMQIQQRWIIR